jgi:hypothetical protein
MYIQLQKCSTILALRLLKVLHKITLGYSIFRTVAGGRKEGACFFTRCYWFMA